MDNDTIIQDVLKVVPEVIPPVVPAPPPAVPPVELSEQEKAALAQKNNQAFAAMRVTNKTQADEIETLKAELEKLKVVPPNTPPVVPPVPETNPEIAALQKEIADIKNANTERQQAVGRDHAVRGLVAVRNEFQLDEAGLKTFTAQAERSGFDITNPAVDVRTVYMALNAQAVIDQEVARVKQEYAKNNNAPGVGVRGAGNQHTTNATAKARLDAIAEKYLPKK